MKILFFIPVLISATTLVGQKTDSLAPRVYNWDNLQEIKEGSHFKKDIIKGSTTSLSYFEVYSMALEPGGSPHPPHTDNDKEELIIIKEGLLKVTIKGTSKIMGTGSIAYIMPGDEHGIVNAGTIPATYYMFKYRSKLPMDLERAKQNGGSFMIDWKDLPGEKTAKGHRRSFFNKATSQLEKFEMHTTALDAGLDSHAPHTHKEEEIILLLKGNVEMFIAGTLYNASPGDVIYLSSGVSHALKNTGGEQCEYFAFQWRN